MTITSCPTSRLHIEPHAGYDLNKLALKKIFDSFAPQTDFAYVQMVDQSLRDLAAACWDTCLIRTFIGNERPVGYLGSVLLKPGAHDVAANYGAEEDLMSHVIGFGHTPASLSDANNLLTGSEAYVALIFWDTSLHLEDQLAILRLMAEHFRRFFAGNVINSIFIQALSEFDVYLEGREYQRTSTLDSSTNLSVWRRIPVSRPNDAVEDYFALRLPPIVPKGVPSEVLKNTSRIQLRYLYEYGWKIENIKKLFTSKSQSQLTTFKTLICEGRRYLNLLHEEHDLGIQSPSNLRAWREFVSDVRRGNNLPLDLQNRILPRILARASATNSSHWSFDRISSNEY